MKILCYFLTLMSISIPSLSAENKSLNELMEQWINIESQKGNLQLSWNTRRQQLEQSQSLLASEIGVLKQVLKKTGSEKSDVDNKRIQLSEKQSLLEQEQVLVKNQIAQATDFTRALVVRLPPPLQSQWREKRLLLTQAGATDSEKLERLLTLYKLVNEFDERIALNRSSMEIPNSANESQNLLVTQMYLGVSQGWYVSDDGLYYGYGRASKLGWQWWHNEAASAELGRILDPQDLLQLKGILQKPTTAKFINLPVKVNENKDVS
jgi:hypothetical protein